MQSTYDNGSTETLRESTWWASALRRFALAWERPILSGLMALIVYVLIARHYGSILRISNYPYFNYLADAFLHGQLHLRAVPNSAHDLSQFHGRYYLYWPPFPAIVVMPLVAIFGVNVSDVLMTTIVAALNVGLVAQLLRQSDEQGITHLSATQRGLLALFFAFGTVHLTLAPFGRVWSFAQLIGFMMVGLAYLVALRQRGLWAFGLAGLAIAAAFSTRNHLVLAGLWPAWYLLREHWTLTWRRLMAYTLAGLVPLIVAVVLSGVYNSLRFGSMLDNGLDYHRMNPRFLADYRRYGAFSLHYAPINLLYQYIFYPLPLRSTSTLGGSLFLLSPLFFGALRSLALKQHWQSNWVLAATIVTVATPITLLMGTGWVQWGPRYTLDYTVPLLLLTAVGIRRWPIWVIAVLVAISIVHYGVGIYYAAPALVV